MRGFAGVVAIIVLAMLAAVLAVRVLAPGMLPTSGDQANLAYLVGWLALLSVSIFAFGRMPLGGAFRSLLIWAGIGLFLIAIYALRDDFAELYTEITGEIAPYMPAEMVEAPEPDAADMAPATGIVSLRRSRDGHFWADATVNGATVRMLVDTGASTVALTEADARRIGLNPGTLRYTAEVSTAGGITRGAPVRLRRVAVGSVALENVQAIVIEGDALPISLLGMSYLGELSGYAATQDELILRR
jgi:aspartyl protease family protein